MRAGDQRGETTEKSFKCANRISHDDCRCMIFLSCAGTMCRLRPACLSATYLFSCRISSTGLSGQNTMPLTNVNVMVKRCSIPSAFRWLNSRVIPRRGCLPDSLVSVAFHDGAQGNQITGYVDFEGERRLASGFLVKCKSCWAY